MAELSTTLTPQHYRVKQIQAQIDELETARQRERTNVLSRIRIEYEASLKRESQLKHDFETQYGVLAGQADDLIQYNILLREAEGNKRLYETTLQQGKEASLASVMRTSNARVVDAARPSGVPYTPNVQFNLTLGMLGTLMCGVLFVVVRSRSDLRIQVPGVLGTQLNLRELGIIPAAKTDPAVRTLPRSGSRRDGNILLPRPDGLTDGLELVTLKRKPSIMAEAFRATMASIMFSGEHEKPSVLLFTSPSPREGKSTIVCNLAIAFAEIHNRVLLIDGDMRLPRLHKVFNIPNTSGLSDILHERGAIEDYVDQALSRKTSIPDLEVLPAGPARTNLSQLLYSSRMTELIRRLRRSFDIILIDSPPVLSVPDARILARNADAVILVARAHQTQQEAAIAAARCFAEDGRRILGTILNDWNPNVSAYGQYGFYGAYAAYGASNDSPYYPEDHS
jgi:capsular exopolysaccharide synthesis family protein